MLFEYAPSLRDAVSGSKLTKLASQRLTPTQLQKIKLAFNQFDTNKSGALSRKQMRSVIGAMDVLIKNDKELDDIFEVIDQDRSGDITLDEMNDMFINQSYTQRHLGKYLVVLSLIEAESLRRVLHVRKNRPLVPGAQVIGQLRINNGPIIDTTADFIQTPEYQLTSWLQCARFFDSCYQYTPRQLNLLLRVLQSTECKKRLDFFTQVRACRRRQQSSIENQAIARLFSTPDEFYLLNQRALYSQIRERLEERGLGIRDAFIAFDYNNDAILTCSELYGGLDWLGLKLTPEDIYSMVHDMNTSQKGTILYVLGKPHCMFDHL